MQECVVSYKKKEREEPMSITIIFIILTAVAVCEI